MVLSLSPFVNNSLQFEVHLLFKLLRHRSLHIVVVWPSFHYYRYDMHINLN